LEYAWVVWNSITSTDASKLKRIQQKFASVCFYRVFPHVPYIYTDALKKLNLQTLRKRRQHHVAIFFFFMSIVVLNLALPFWKMLAFVFLPAAFRDFQLFGVCPSNKHCPSARRAYAANAVGKDLDVFAIGAVSLKHIEFD
jgi:hypothetical protein